MRKIFSNLLKYHFKITGASSASSNEFKASFAATDVNVIPGFSSPDILADF
jgi:hypothetical protein